MARRIANGEFRREAILTDSVSLHLLAIKRDKSRVVVAGSIPTRSTVLDAPIKGRNFLEKKTIRAIIFHLACLSFSFSRAFSRVYLAGASNRKNSSE